MVEVFLNPNHVEPCVQSAIKINAKVVWMQIGVIHEEAAKLAEDKGLTVIMDRCPKREIPRLGLKL
jgi:predicted CoA-binding protein